MRPPLTGLSFLLIIFSLFSPVRAYRMPDRNLTGYYPLVLPLMACAQLSNGRKVMHSRNGESDVHVPVISEIR